MSNIREKTYVHYAREEKAISVEKCVQLITPRILTLMLLLRHRVLLTTYEYYAHIYVYII